MRLKGTSDRLNTFLDKRHQKETKYLDRQISLTADCIIVQGGDKHVKVLLKGRSMEGYKGLETPLPDEIDDIKINEELTAPQD